MRMILPVFATLALVACNGRDDGADADGAAIAESTAAPLDGGAMAAPAATETVFATPGASMTAKEGSTTITTGPGGTAVTVDGRDVDASMGPDGATATLSPDR